MTFLTGNGIFQPEVAFFISEMEFLDRKWHFQTGNVISNRKCHFKPEMSFQTGNGIFKPKMAFSNRKWNFQTQNVMFQPEFAFSDRKSQFPYRK